MDSNSPANRNAQKEGASIRRRSVLGRGVALALLPALNPVRVFGQSAFAPNLNYNTTVPDWVPTLKSKLLDMAATLECTVLPWNGPALSATPEQYGYTAASTPSQTAASIQAAIDFLTSKGGGTVNLSNGDYLSGTIVLKNNVRLNINEGARLVASTNQADYPKLIPVTQTVMDTYYQEFVSLIYAERATNISVAGKGTIDGQGRTYPRQDNNFANVFRPFVMRIVECKNIHVTDVTMINSPAWMHDYLACDNLLVENITVSNLANINNDGIDIDGCQSVIVRNSIFHSEDDGICFKGTSGRLMKNVLVRDCQAYSSTNACKIGTDTQGSFDSFLIYKCTLGGPTTDRTALYAQLGIPTDPKRVKGGFSWESTDGGTVSNILVSKCTITRSKSPLFLTLGNRNRRIPGTPVPAPGAVQRIVFDQISGTDNGPNGSWFSGLTSKPITDVVLSNINLGLNAYTGPVPADPPEIGTSYPDPGANPLPTYGLWARHVTNLTIANCNWTLTGTDTRPMIEVKPT